MKIEIVEMTEDLIKYVHNIEVQSFSTPWSEKSFLDELNNSAAYYFVALAEDFPAGYVGMWEISGQCDITNIAVLPDYRGKGIGSALLTHLIEKCKKQLLSPITLEVREHNVPAIELYKSFHFKPIGFRKKYYSDTGEDAIIMSLEI